MNHFQLRIKSKSLEVILKELCRQVQDCQARTFDEVHESNNAINLIMIYTELIKSLFLAFFQLLNFPHFRPVFKSTTG